MSRIAYFAALTDGRGAVAPGRPLRPPRRIFHREPFPAPDGAPADGVVGAPVSPFPARDLELARPAVNSPEAPAAARSTPSDPVTDDGRTLAVDLKPAVPLSPPPPATAPHTAAPPPTSDVRPSLRTVRPASVRRLRRCLSGEARPAPLPGRAPSRPGSVARRQPSDRPPSRRGRTVRSRPSSRRDHERWRRHGSRATRRLLSPGTAPSRSQPRRRRCTSGRSKCWYRPHPSRPTGERARCVPGRVPRNRRLARRTAGLGSRRGRTE